MSNIYLTFIYGKNRIFVCSFVYHIFWIEWVGLVFFFFFFFCGCGIDLGRGGEFQIARNIVQDEHSRETQTLRIYIYRYIYIFLAYGLFSTMWVIFSYAWEGHSSLQNIMIMILVKFVPRELINIFRYLGDVHILLTSQLDIFQK